MRNNKRRQHRMPAYLGGRIFTDRRRTFIECVVRDMSESGAKLRLPSTMLLPDEFELQIPTRNTSHRAHVRWRNAIEVGVEFASVPKSSNAPVPISTARSRLRSANTGLRRTFR